MTIICSGAGSCPECGIALRRSNYRVQLFEDAMVEKEVDIRKRVLRDYNKKEEDFANLRDYNDYLEEIETIIFNLVNNIDIVITNKKIESYKKENKDLIMKNKSKSTRDEYELEELLELEKQQEELRKKELRQEEEEIKKKKIREKEALIDELMFSTENAKNIMETFAQNAQQSKEEAKEVPVSKISQFSTGIQFGRQSQVGFLPVPVEEGPQFEYTPLVLPTEGPKPPSEIDLEPNGYLNNVRIETEQERAGGFKSQISCLRALQEALVGLYHVTQPTSYNN